MLCQFQEFLQSILNQFLMKKLSLLTLFMVGLMVFGQRETFVHVSTSGLNCSVALISDAESGGRQYGWWDAWHDKKEKRQVKDAPCTFEDVQPGKYTLVVYYKDSQTNGAQSDGIALENLEIGSYTTMINYTFQKYDFKDWNCLSCPWLCVFDGEKYNKQEEVIKDVVGYKNRTTTSASLSAASIIDGKVRIQIREEKDEISYLDQVVLKIGDQLVQANESDTRLNDQDDSFYDLHKGDVVNLEFDVPAGTTEEMEVQVTGYYHPEPGFMEAVTARLLER